VLAKCRLPWTIIGRAGGRATGARTEEEVAIPIGYLELLLEGWAVPRIGRPCGELRTRKGASCPTAIRAVPGAAKHPFGCPVKPSTVTALSETLNRSNIGPQIFASPCTRQFMADSPSTQLFATNRAQSAALRAVVRCSQTPRWGQTK
jgi:hypothetical protein